jgi:hypothetical protein
MPEGRVILIVTDKGRVTAVAIGGEDMVPNKR